jgi:tetratricopeptide (TPR) repeat protein
MPPDPEKIHADSCAALDRGRYDEAIELATQCLKVAPTDSYWYPGALGLRCWAANYTGDDIMVARDAHTLLAFDTGNEKMWFDGLAVLNLALVRRRVGDAGQAETLFDQARAKFQAYRINPGKPDEWRLARELFEALSYWGASGETDKIDDMAGRLSVVANPSDEVERLKKVIDLYQRYTRGEDVVKEARQAAIDGVSRVLLALILIK